MHKSGRVVWRGGNVLEGTSGYHGQVGFDATKDQPGLRPTESVILAAAACGAMDVASILEKKRQTITHYEVGVEAEQRDEHPQVLTSLVLTHELEGGALDVEAARRAIELSATKYCAVSNTLSAGDVTLHHRYRVRNAEGLHEAEVVTTGPRGRVVKGDAPVPGR